MNKQRKKSVHVPRDEQSLWLLPQPFDFETDHGWLYSKVRDRSFIEPERPSSRDKTVLRDFRRKQLAWRKEVNSVRMLELYIPPDEVFLKFLGRWRNKRPSILHLHPVSDVELMAYGHWLGERDLVIDVEPVDDRLYDFVWVRPATGSTYDRWSDDVERAVRACKAGGALWVGKGSGMGDNALLGPIQALLEGEDGVSMEVVSSSPLGWGFM